MGQGAPKRCPPTDYALAELRRQVKCVAGPFKAVVARLPLLAADSTGRRNRLTEHLGRRFKVEGLTRPLIQLSRNRVELDL